MITKKGEGGDISFDVKYRPLDLVNCNNNLFDFIFFLLFLQVDLLMGFLLQGWLPTSLTNVRHLQQMLDLLHIDIQGIEQVRLLIFPHFLEIRYILFNYFNIDDLMSNLFMLSELRSFYLAFLHNRPPPFSELSIDFSWLL